jgi:Glycosyl hydrolase family 59
MRGIRFVAAVAAVSLTILVTRQIFASTDVSSTSQAAQKSDSPLPSNQVTSNAGVNVVTSVKVDRADAGRIFDGIGAISGGGGNSRLLIDYPVKQRNQILDYLFKPGYGASLQILKLEIGGDANSTDGSEPSVEHARGVVNCNAGYEFWLAKQAKLRNPNIKLYGLAWAAPGWIDNGNFWSQDMIHYLMTWMGCARSHGLTIDYLGGWNEKGFNKSWYENLPTTLATNHYTTTVVGDDSDWDVAKTMSKDPVFAKAVDIIGVHYSCEGGDGGNANSCHSTQEAVDMNKPLWDSENGSQDDDSGAGPLIRAITRGYIDAKMTALLNWPLIAAITSNLPYPTTGLMVASEPWSGHYSVGQSLWVTAHVTQFAQPGWQFLNHASGYLGNERTNGSYISLRSPNGTDYSTIVETTTATVASTMIFNFGASFAGKSLSVWATNLHSTTEDQFAHITDLHLDDTGSSKFNLRPGYVYTFSTLVTAGKGDATAPPAHPLGLPYRDNFNDYKIGSEARYISDMQGAFEIQKCAAGRPGNCLQQMAAIKPIEWQDNSDAFTLLGDPSWANYAASVDVELVKPGVAELIGRAGTQKRPQSHQQGYYFQISDSGAWTIFKSDSNGKHTMLATGSTTALGTGSWHRLGLAFNDEAITASLDGQTVKVLTDNAYHSGQLGMGITSYDTDQFDNISILPVKVTKPTEVN